MPYPGQFVEAFAKILGEPQARVARYNRVLAEAGLRRTGARGKNAPEVEPLDAARLLVALLATNRVSEAPSKAHRLGCFRHKAQFATSHIGVPPSIVVTALQGLPSDHSFDEGVACVLAHSEFLLSDAGPDSDFASARRFDAPCIIYQEPTAMIVVGTTTFAYQDPELSDPNWHPPMRSTQSLASRYVHQVGMLLKSHSN